MVFTPHCGHLLRGIRERMTVWNCIVSRCRQHAVVLRQFAHAASVATLDDRLK